MRTVEKVTFVGRLLTAPSLAWLLAIAASLALTSAGCERPGPQPRISPSLPDHSAEGRLERVKQRLTAALADAQAASGSGIVSQRRCSVELIRPSKDGDAFKAKVTIFTKVAIDDAEAREAANSAAIKPVGPESLDDPALKDDLEPLEKRETIDLVFQDGAWQMVNKPEGETEQICMEYALRR